MLYQHFTSDERDALQVMIDKDLDTATSFSNASRTMAFSIVDCCWSEDILAFTVPAGMLSPKSAGNSSRDGTRCAATCSPMPA